MGWEGSGHPGYLDAPDAELPAPRTRAVQLWTWGIPGVQMPRVCLVVLRTSSGVWTATLPL